MNKILGARTREGSRVAPRFCLSSERTELLLVRRERLQEESGENIKNSSSRCAMDPRLGEEVQVKDAYLVGCQ